MKRKAFMTMCSAMVSLVLIGWLSTPQAVAKKGGKPQDPPPEPSFRYLFAAIHDDDVAEWSHVTGVNNHGDVIGEYQPIDGGLPVPFIGSVSDGMVDLNSFVDPAADVLLYRANAINDSCQVTGYAYYFPDPDTPVRFGFRFTPPAPGEDYGTVDMIGGLGEEIIGTSINNEGDVAGRMYVNGWRAFICTDEDGLVDLTPISPLATLGEALSNRVDGVLKATGRGLGSRAWRYEGAVGQLAGGSVTDIGTLKSDNDGNAEAFDINDSGQIVGTADADPAKGNENSRAFRDDELTGMLNLGTLASTRDWNDSSGRGLNNHGDAVGMSLDGNFPNQRAFLYTDDDGLGMLDLTQLTEGVPADVMSGDYFNPTDINESGDISGPHVGNFNFVNGVPKAFLLIRVPAP